MGHRRRLAAALLALALASVLVPAAAAAQVPPPPPGTPPPPPQGVPPPPPQGYPPPQPQYAPPPPVKAAPAKRRVELTAFGGWQINSDVYGTSGHLSVGDAAAYGASVGVETFPNAFAELMWIYSNPEMHASGTPLLNGSSKFNVATHYFQIGGTKGIQRERLNFYGGASIGAALFMPQSIRLSNGDSAALSDTWRFAFTLGLGLKIDLHEKIALRFDGRVAAPVYFSSGGIYVGGGGAGVTVGGGIPIWQWNFLGGLVFRP
jgi:opacity protein-like surface antigen